MALTIFRNTPKYRAPEKYWHIVKKKSWESAGQAQVVSRVIYTACDKRYVLEQKRRDFKIEEYTRKRRNHICPQCLALLKQTIQERQRSTTTNNDS